MTLGKTGGKFTIEGPFSIGDPVHETITVHALRAAGVLTARESHASPAARDFIRGVFWNDDPECKLFENMVNLAPSYGAFWLIEFKEAEFGGTTALDKLLGRSHFGDLQFLHGMASQENESPETTRRNVLGWAEFTYRLSIGDLSIDSDVGDFDSVGTLLARGERRIARALFCADSAPTARKRAFGSLLHLIQDSYAAGHVDRKEENGRRGRIQEFHAYNKQDHDKHKADDGWRDGTTGMEGIKAIVGGEDALRESTAMLSFYLRKAPWKDVETYLSEGPFKLDTSARPASAGKNYGKK
jgi:hypothetical protein